MSHTRQTLPGPFDAAARGARCALGPAALTLALFAVAATSNAGTSGPATPARTGVIPPAGSMVPNYPLQSKEFAFIKEGEYFHIFWMRHDFLVPYDSTERDLGHAVSRDLIHWTQLPPVLTTREDKWDNLHIWAPTILKSGDTFYMYYTGVTHVPYGWNLFQRIGLATSTDLINWTQTDQPVLSGAMIPWVFADSSVFAGCQFRDPFAMPDPTMPGRTLLYYVGVPAEVRSQLIVGVAQSSDLLNFTDLMPLWATDEAHYWGWCESPHIIEHNGLYYLFATTGSGHPIGFRTAPSPVADSTEWSGKYRLFDMANQDSVADAWFGSETLSIPGHDYLAVLNSTDYRVDIYEIIWDPTPPGFTLASPGVANGVPVPETPALLSLTTLPRTGAGPGVMFRASLPAAGEARVDLFDVGGRRVRTLHSGPLPDGESVVAWDGRLGGGNVAPAGVYFAALSTAAGRRVARVSVMN